MPYRPVTLGLKFNIRLSDLTAADVVRMTCPRCTHRYSVAPHILLERFPSHLKIQDLEKQMKCKRCDYKGSMRWTVERAEARIRVAKPSS